VTFLPGGEAISSRGRAGRGLIESLGGGEGKAVQKSRFLGGSTSGFGAGLACLAMVGRGAEAVPGLTNARFAGILVA